MSDEYIALIMKQYKRGISIRDIAKSIGYNYAYVYCVIRDEKAKYDEEKKATIYKAYLHGAKVINLAELFGYSRGMIYNIIRDRT